MTFERNILFDNSCRIRPVSAFNLETLLEVDVKAFRRYLTADAKMYWFHWYCLEQGIKGKVETTFLSIEDLGNTNVQMENGQFFETKVYKEYWNATVYMNDVEISSATSSGTFILMDNEERDNASNSLRKNAIGAALSQAGFGVISGFDMTANDIAQFCAEAALQNQQIHPVQPPMATPVVAPAVNHTQTTAPIQPVAPTHVVQNSFFGNAPSTPAVPNFDFGQPSNIAIPPVQNQVVQPQLQVDPLTEAKQMMWQGGGQFKGKTLGQILSERGVNGISYIVNDYMPRTQEGHQVKAAAKLILDSLQMGK